MMCKKKTNLYKIFFVIFLMYFLLQNLLKLNQICVIDDEFGYWGVGAYFAGYEWTGLTPTSPYYGYGLGFVYMLFFKVFSDPSLMYKAAVIFNAIVLVLAYFLSITCMKRLYTNIDEKYIVLFCSLTTLYPNTIVQSQIAWTESLLYFWFWVCFFLTIEVSSKPTVLNCIAYPVILLYGYMIHQRTLGVIISGVIIFGLNIALKRMKKRYILAFFIAFFITFLFSYQTKNMLLEKFWVTINQNVANMNNLSGQVGKIQYIFSKEGIFSLFYGCLGKMLYLIFSTSGLIILSISSLIKVLLGAGKNIVIKKQSKIAGITVSEISALFICLAFFSTFAISAIFMVVYTTRLDVLVYGRYNEFTIGPLLVIGALEAIRCKKGKKGILLIIAGIIAATFVLSYAVTKNEFTIFNGMNAVGISEYFSSLNKSPYVFFEIVLLLLVVICAIGIFSMRLGCAYGLGCLLIIAIWYSSIKYNCDAIYYSQKTYAKNTEDIANYIKTQKADKIIKYVTAEDETGLSSDDLYDRNIKYVQFYLYDRKIAVQGASEIVENDNSEIYIVRKESSACIELRKKFELKYENDLYIVFT